jgi:hypothetical protein
MMDVPHWLCVDAIYEVGGNMDVSRETHGFFIEYRSGRGRTY